MPITKLFSRIPSVAALLIVSSLVTGCGDEGGTKSAAAPVSVPTVIASVSLSGTPMTTILAGNDYLFQPKVLSGGGIVRFSIQGQPHWASFDTDTGVLNGTPAKSDAGRTGSIVISGTNGSTSASISPFVIVVNVPPAATGSATLSWNAPTENTDGTPVTGLAGYHIYYGTSANELTMTATVAGATETTYMVSGLAVGTYYFSVAAFNAAGVDSAQSATASETI